MREVVIRAKVSDIRHVWISCRCGKRSEASIPIQVAKASNLHICPQCGATFTIRLQSGGNTLSLKRKERWQIERQQGNVQDMILE